MQENFIRQKCYNLAYKINDNLPLNKNVFNAFVEVDREIFIPSVFKRHAYSLNALPMQNDQWISSPLTVAKMTLALELKEQNKVLEIGCGSGYQAAILSKIAKEVYTIERVKSLYHEAKQRFELLGVKNITLKYSDGLNGFLSYSPYDRVLFSAAIKQVPNVFYNQLKVGGILVAPIIYQNSQQIIQFTKTKTSFTQKNLGKCSFVDAKLGLE